MKKLITAVFTALFLGHNPALISAVENATVQSVRVSAESVYIVTDKPVQYKAFTTDQPPRLVLELMDSKLRTLQEIPVNGRSLQKVRTGQFKDSPVSVSRVVMELSQKIPYEIIRKGAELVVMFGTRPRKQAAQLIKDAPAAVPAGVLVIAPEPTAEKAVELTLEAEPTKAADLGRRRAPVTSVRKVYSAPSSHNIMDSLSREPITFDYSEADVREVIDMLAAKANINIIYSDDVSGTVTISLEKVPFEEAFKTLLNIKGLTTQQSGDNILRIAMPATFISEQRKAMVQTRVFFISYGARAADVKAQVEAVAQAEGRTLKCINDENNNALIITDTPLGLDSTARLIRSLDRTPKQVMIEVKLVEVNLDDSFELGVDLGFKAKGNDAYGTTGGAKSDFAGSLTFGKVTASERLNGILTAKSSKGKIKVLSDPKVATLNNKQATIEITNQIPYALQTVTIVNNSPQTATTYSNVTTGITLKVTPAINPDGRITMHLAPQVIQLGNFSGVGPPPTNTRATDTNVVVKNGETIVIGGLIQDTMTNDVFKVPVLGDIPLLGALFRKKSTSRVRKELLIFVTPKIIED